MEPENGSAESSGGSAMEYVNTLYTESVIAVCADVSVNVIGDEVGSGSLPHKDEERKGMRVLGQYGVQQSTDVTNTPKPLFRKMYLAALAALINAVCMGFSAAYSATATDDMKGPNTLNPNPDEITWIGSLVAIGALFGSLAAGKLAGTFGRKVSLFFNTVPFFFGWMFIAYATSVPLVFVGRLLNGFACGLTCVVAPMYLVEISTPEVRGLLGASFQLFVTIGILLVSIMGSYLTWRYLAVAGSITTIISAIALAPMPETPRWLMAKGRPLGAAMALKFLQGNNYNASATCQSLEESIKVNSVTELAMKDLKPHVKLGRNVQSIFKSPAGWKSMLLSFGLMVFQQFSGINAVMFYTVEIFKTTSGPSSAKMYTIILNAVQVVATLVGSLLTDRAGRRFLLLFSGFVMTLSLTALGTFSLMSAHNPDKTYSWVPLVCLGLYIISFSVGFGPIPWLMVAEMTPSRYRSAISGLATALNWTLVFAVTKSFDSLKAGVQDYGTYWIYAFFCAASCLFTYFFLPETKGKSLVEIQEFFISKKQKEARLSLTAESSEYI